MCGGGRAGLAAIATPHTTRTQAAVVIKNFNFSKNRHSENLKKIFHTNNTDYDFRYINISNLLQPYFAEV